MALTDDITIVANALKQICLTNRSAWGIAYDEDIFYGDQEKIPHNPAICIETGEKTRELARAPRIVDSDILVYVLIYHNPLKDTQVSREDNDRFAEQVATALEANEDLGGIIIHGYVTSLEPGFQIKSGTMYRATRITYTAKSRVQLPYSAA